MIWGGTGMREIVAGSPSLVSMAARIIAICVSCVATEARESPRLFDAEDPSGKVLPAQKNCLSLF